MIAHIFTARQIHISPCNETADGEGISLARDRLEQPKLVPVDTIAELPASYLRTYKALSGGFSPPV